MSSTTTIEAAQPALTLTLQNGQDIRFHSDTSIEADEIPVIDIAGIFSDDIADRKAVAEEIREAAHRIGFFYIVNHGIDDKYAAATFAEAKKFFGQEEEEKMTVCTDLVEDYFGYFPMARVRLSFLTHLHAWTPALLTVTQVQPQRQEAERSHGSVQLGLQPEV